MNDSDLNLAYFKILIEQRLADLEPLLEGAESRSQSVELDQGKVVGCRGWMHFNNKR